MALVSVVSFYYKIASPIYFATAAFFAIYFIGNYAEGFSYRGWTAGSVELFGELAVTIAIIAGLLLVVEGRLISRFSFHDASPFLMQTKRGLRAAAFKGKRLWLLPMLFLVPGI